MNGPSGKNRVSLTDKFSLLATLINRTPGFPQSDEFSISIVNVSSALCVFNRKPRGIDFKFCYILHRIDGRGKNVYAIFRYVSMCEQIRNTRSKISIRPNPRFKQCFLTWWERVSFHERLSSVSFAMPL